MEVADKVNVLVVDDEPDICNVIRILLERDGYSVTCVHNGEEAVEAIYKNSFDAILTDLKMPGLDGFAVLKKAKEINPMTPVIILTAYGSQDSAIEATRCGAASYIIKPFLNDELRQIVRITIERHKMLLKLIKDDVGLG